MNEVDPAQTQESDTVVAPQTTEEVAESPDGTPTEESAKQEDQSEHVEITVEGEEPPQKDAAAPWVQELRKGRREDKARIADLERKLNAYESPTRDLDPGPKPTLKDCDFDADVYEKNFGVWQEKCRQKEAADAQAAQRANAQRQEWQTRLDTYAKSKEDLSKQIPGYADAEAAVQAVLDITQQGVILHGSQNPALVVAALGQNPKLVQDLASEKDPIRFAFKIANLEARLKTTKKTNTPPPEKPVRGSGPSSGAVDSQLEKLRAAAEKSGDNSKVNEYLRSKRAQR